MTRKSATYMECCCVLVGQIDLLMTLKGVVDKESREREERGEEGKREGEGWRERTKEKEGEKRRELKERASSREKEGSMRLHN